MAIYSGYCNFYQKIMNNWFSWLIYLVVAIAIFGSVIKLAYS